MILSSLYQIKNLSKKADKAFEIDALAKAGHQSFLNIIFDKDVRFFVATKKLNTNCDCNLVFDSTEELNQELLELLELLAKGEFRGNEAIIKCNTLISKFECSEEIEMFIDILENKLRLGIGATDVNKLCKNLKIEQFEVMFAQQQDKAKYYDDQSYVIQPKIDGMRCICIKDINGVNFYTRTGKGITSLNFLKNIIGESEGHFVLDGEIEQGSLEETGAIRRKNQEAEEAVYTLFGLYDIDQWKTKQHSDTYAEVYSRAYTYEREICSKHIRVIPSYSLGYPIDLRFKDLIEKFNAQFLELGYEGSVVKTILHNYNPSTGSKRSSDWIKIKPWQDSNGTVLDILEGEGEHKGMVGKFWIRWSGDNFEVAPGKLNHETRKYIFENPT